MPVNFITKGRRRQFIETRILRSRQDVIWMFIIPLTKYVYLRSKFDLQHSLSCMKGGFVSLRHNHLRNIAVNITDHLCHDVQIEPPFQSLTGETFDRRSANVRDDESLQNSARRFLDEITNNIFWRKGF